MSGLCVLKSYMLSVSRGRCGRSLGCSCRCRAVFCWVCWCRVERLVRRCGRRRGIPWYQGPGIGDQGSRGQGSIASVEGLGGGQYGVGVIPDWEPAVDGWGTTNVEGRARCKTGQLFPWDQPLPGSSMRLPHVGGVRSPSYPTPTDRPRATGPSLLLGTLRLRGVCIHLGCLMNPTAMLSCALERLRHDGGFRGGWDAGASDS